VCLSSFRNAVNQPDPVENTLRGHGRPSKNLILTWRLSGMVGAMSKPSISIFFNPAQTVHVS
jgi:hypothetical protein